jgi:C4-dicarboxylate-specific signal transduction histidine kinase
MKRDPDPIGDAGLQFFGRMSASISHELKNALAIIKENAGLLGDYVVMMGKGTPVDPQRFQTIAQRIDGQTRRADTIIKDLNQFAHSVDSSGKPVDLNNILELLVALHRRPAAMQQVSLEPLPADSAVVITTAPFLLLNALGLILAFALKTVPAEAVITIAVSMDPSGAEIRFGGLKALADLSTDQFSGDHENVLLTVLGAKAIIDAAHSQIIVRLPLQQ